MSLRVRLVLAFFLLAVVPLTAVTLYSYVASQRAFRAAVEAEAGLLADDMRLRMDTATGELGQRLAELGDMPGPADQEMDAEDAARLGRRVADMAGDIAGLVGSLEIVPEPPDPSAPDRDLERPPDQAPGHPPAPPAPAPPGSIVIDLPALTRVPLPPEARAEIERAQQEAMAAVQEATREAQEDARQAREERHREQTEGGREAWRERVAALRERAHQRRERERREARLILGREFHFPLKKHGKPVATMRAHVKARQLLDRVLARGRRSDEIPFAIDADGTLHASEADLSRLQALPLASAPKGGRERREALPEWVVVTRKDPGSGLTMGVARPIGEPLKEIRRTALRNLGLGLGAVALAVVGILPLSRRVTGELETLTQGAERLALGDLEARVPVRSRDEVGRLAEAFNRMAHELRANQERLLAQERLQRELEMGRRIQEEMLPRDSLRIPFAEAKGLSIPAREVGGDFFNYFTLPSGEAALLVGDVSGKGVAAALLMANLQATLRARLPLEHGLSVLADELDREIEASSGGSMYLTLFMGVLDRAGQMRYVNAGHNMPFVLHADGRIEALDSTGRPLGLLAGGGYGERRVALDAGTCLFLYTDGVVDSENEAGEPFGTERLQKLLVEERASGLEGILARVEEAVRTYRAGAEAADDATIVVLKVGGHPALAETLV